MINYIQADFEYLESSGAEKKEDEDPIPTESDMDIQNYIIGEKKAHLVNT